MDPLSRSQGTHPPITKPKPHPTIGQRLDKATDNIAGGAAHTARGAAKTAVNAPLIAGEGLATVAVISGGSLVLAGEGIASGVAATTGVIVGLGVDAFELTGKGVKALGNAVESVGNAAENLRKGSDDLLMITAYTMTKLARKGLQSIHRSFDAGVDAVSPKQ